MAGVEMNKTKFTVRVDAEALNAAKQYARQHSITVTDLVEEFFRSLDKVDQLTYGTPILAELAGSLSTDVSIEDYHTYLEEKYLGDKNSGR
jgi:hypothetical protein